MLELVNENGISEEQLSAYLDDFITKYINESVKKLLLIPPDYTRGYSRAGEISRILYQKLNKSVKIDIMPAVGTHMEMSNELLDLMFTDAIPKSCFLYHDWREGNVSLGEIPQNVVSEISEGLINEPIEVEVDKRLVEGDYDLMVSIGQVVPHEVVGIANYSKNIYVGCGGRQMINKTHMVGAVCGMENAMGKDFAPVRKLYDYAEMNYSDKLRPLVYMLTVINSEGDKLLSVHESPAQDRSAFEKAVVMTQKHNIFYIPKPQKKVVAYLDEHEFTTTWVGNKAIYRSRMLIADGGELIVLAPGVRHFGESDEIDSSIRKFGYRGRDYVLDFYNRNDPDKPPYMVAAHLIHGSNDGRFTTTYAAKKLTKEEVEGVNFSYMDFDEAMKKYDPSKLKLGINVLDDGEEIFFIPNPALGLWMSEDRK